MHYLHYLLVGLMLLFPCTAMAAPADSISDSQLQPSATVEADIPVSSFQPQPSPTAEVAEPVSSNQPLPNPTIEIAVPASSIQPQPSPTTEVEVPVDMEVQPVFGNTPLDSLVAWITYWDMDSALEEMGLSTIPLSSLIYFAAYFNENNALFVPDEIGELQICVSMLDNVKPVEYLSFVNDRILTNGKALQKDTGILRTLLLEEVTRQRHIKDIISITRAMGFDAIEIDYEAFVKDDELLRQFGVFISELYEKTAALHMPLRVVLEPSMPFDRVSLPEGPEYVIMCYNLFGTHSGPGPKANPKFLQKVVTAAEALPGKKTFALSIGGYHWIQQTNARDITFIQAQILLKQQSAIAYRDAESGCVYFCYRDADDRENEVWYADDETLRIWIEAIKEIGDYDINIWRLGGNEPWSKE